MLSAHTQYLHELLTTFGAARLGEGDPVAGANLLATMACSIANIQRHGSGLKAPDGETLAVGTSLMVSASLTTSLISEKDGVSDFARFKQVCPNVMDGSIPVSGMLARKIRTRQRRRSGGRFGNQRILFREKFRNRSQIPETPQAEPLA